MNPEESPAVSESLVIDWLKRIESKVDTAISLMSRVDTTERDIQELKDDHEKTVGKVSDIERVQITHKTQIQMLTGLFVVLGAPILVGLAVMGAAKWMGL